MQILVKHDNHTEGGARFIDYVQNSVQSGLSRFNERITTAHVHVSDQNSAAKSKNNDIKCSLEVHVNGMKPMAVTNMADDVDQAVSGAIDKMERLLDKTFDKLSDTKGRPSFSGDPLH